MSRLERIIASIPYPIQDALIVLVGVPLWSVMFALAVAGLVSLAVGMFYLGLVVAGGA